MTKRALQCIKCNRVQKKWPYELKLITNMNAFVCRNCIATPLVDRHCKQCNVIFCVRDSSPKLFCTRACSAIFNNSKRDSDYYKHLKNKLKKDNCCCCGVECKINIHTNSKYTYCSDCKIPYRNRCEYTCTWCGETTIGYKTHKICRQYGRLVKTLNYFYNIKNVKGTTKFKTAVETAIDILQKEYFIDQQSLSAICEKYHYPDKGTLGAFMKKCLHVMLRGKGEAIANAYATGRLTPKDSLTYKSGEHTTWNNKTVHYRSSYELDYYIILDEQQIDYIIEAFRIPYFDTEKQKIRTAIPDIYIPSTNTLIEIKSNYTYSRQNMKDRVKAYKDRGYNFKLVLEKKEYIISI